MSRRQMTQSAEGINLEYPGYGILDYTKKSAPAGGEIGFATGCIWRNPANNTGTYNTGFEYVNIGSNGYGTNATATWLEVDPSYLQQNQFGGSSAVMGNSGILYRTILTVANGIAPSATGALKIVDIYTLPASSLIRSGQGLQFSMFFNNTGTTGHTVRVQVVANPTNTGLPSSGAGVAGKTDGTVTVTGGTAFIDTGSAYAPTGTVTFGINVTGQLFKSGAAGSNTQEATVTDIFPPELTTAHTSAWIDQTFTESSAIVFAVCISAVTTATDIVYQGMLVQGYN